MLGKRLINSNSAAAGANCTTDTVNILSNIAGATSIVTYPMDGNSNTLTPFDGYINTGAKFNRNSSSISTSTPHFTNTEDASVSIWVKDIVAPSSGYDNIYIADGNDYFYIGVNPSGEIRTYIDNYQDSVYGRTSYQLNTTNSHITNGDWHHIVVVSKIGSAASGGKYEIYVDGTLNASYGYSSTLRRNSGAAWSSQFGVYGSGVTAFEGVLDEVRVYNKALIGSEVTTLYQETASSTISISNLVSHYKFDGDATDETGNHNGTASSVEFGLNGTDSNVTYAAGKFGNAAVFNGSSSIISVSGQLPSVASDYSISFWANPTTISTSGNTIFTNVNAGGSAVKGQVSVLFYDYNSVKRLRVYIVTTTGSLATAVYDSTSAISTGTFSHIVVNIDINGAPTAYVDGSPFSMSFLANTSVSTQGSDTIFGKHQNASFFNGKIDQVRIFDTALTGNQVTDLYTNETDTTAQLLNFPVGAGCIAAYKLDSNADDISGLYSGTPTDIGYTGMEFQPDFTWIKLRDTVSDHDLIDSVRGATKVLESNNTLAQFTEATNLTSFDSNGFTVGSTARVNKLNEPIVAWNWKAGGAPTATNSAGAGNVPTAGSVKIDGVDSTTALAGTIAATSISANTDSGFSVVDFTTSPSTSDTIAHGLSSPPEMIITKNKNLM